MLIATNAHRNATGPISEEGKKKTRFNAIKHGLTATEPISEEERAAMERAIEAWTDEIRPVGLPEEALVRQAAAASVRLEKCQKAEQEAMQGNVNEALRRWEKKKRHRVRRKAQEIGEDPRGTVEELERSAFGCEWLLGRWRELNATLERGRIWDREQFEKAMRLAGFDPGEVVPGAGDDPAWRGLWDRAHQAAPECGTGAREQGEQGPSVSGGSEEIRRELIRIVAGHVNRLEVRRAEAWEEVEGPERDGVRSNGMIDVSKEGQLRMRYEREASLALNRSLSMLLRLRSARTKDEDRAAKGSAAGIVPKVCVGDGWWREQGASPAPPGCQVVPAGFGAIDTAHHQPTASKSMPESETAAARVSAAPAAHQKRNERRDEEIPGWPNDRNSLELKEIQIIGDPVPPADPERTETLHPAHRGAQPA